MQRISFYEKNTKTPITKSKVKIMRVFYTYKLENILERIELLAGGINSENP